MVTWTYYVRHKYEYAVMFVTDTGVVSVVSTFGNFGYFWSDPGTHILSFLVGCDFGYLKSKFFTKNSIDMVSTKSRIKDDILNLRKVRSMTSRQARECWDSITLADNDSQFLDFQLSYDDLICTSPSMSYPENCEAFFEKMWPLLVCKIRESYEFQNYVFDKDARSDGPPKDS